MHIPTKRIITVIGLFLLVFTTPQPAIAASGRTTRISVSSSMVQANFWSMNPAISADGRFIAFDSVADNLVANDTNGRGDVFLRDRNTGQTTRVSIASKGTEGNEPSYRPAISNDGNVIAFVSLATNLVLGDTNKKSDIFVHTRSTGQTKRVSLGTNGEQANDASNYPAISGDGRFVAFTSQASNLVAGDSNNAMDIFVHDLKDGITTRVSVDSDGAQANGDSWWRVAVSEDGRYVAFSSAATNLVSGDTNGSSDIFRHDRNTGETIRVSLTFDGSEANSGSINPSISADGRLVAFESSATNLVSGITNWYGDIFVRDVLASQTVRVSLSSNGIESNDNSFLPKISGDGRFVSFESYATNLVDGDTNGVLDIFTHDRMTGVTNRVSVSTLGVEGNGSSFYGHAISDDGRFVAYGSEASNLVFGDTNGHADIFLHDQNYDPGETVYIYLPLILKP
jgi:Tol biopolymer transport system component